MDKKDLSHELSVRTRGRSFIIERRSARKLTSYTLKLDLVYLTNKDNDLADKGSIRLTDGYELTGSSVVTLVADIVKI